MPCRTVLPQKPPVAQLHIQFNTSVHYYFHHSPTHTLPPNSFSPPTFWSHIPGLSKKFVQYVYKNVILQILGYITVVPFTILPIRHNTLSHLRFHCRKHPWKSSSLKPFSSQCNFNSNHRHIPQMPPPQQLGNKKNRRGLNPASKGMFKHGDGIAGHKLTHD